jgi:outer membrane lipoprotein SlyB
MEQRAATGAATGLLVAGPVGAVVGGAAGVVVNEADEAKDNK